MFTPRWSASWIMAAAWWMLSLEMVQISRTL